MEKDYVELIIPIDKDMVTEMDVQCSIGELVRCKDCKRWEQYSDIPNIGNCTVLDQSRRDCWFCADGERK